MKLTRLPGQSGGWDVEGINYTKCKKQSKTAGVSHSKGTRQNNIHKISRIRARQVIDWRGNLTGEAHPVRPNP